MLVEVFNDNASIKKNLEAIGERASSTVVSEYELLKWHDEEMVREPLSILDLYQFDGNAPENAARIFKELRREGRMINELDILIASIAMSHDELLVTRDKDFKKINNLKVLVL